MPKVPKTATLIKIYFGNKYQENQKSWCMSRDLHVFYIHSGSDTVVRSFSVVEYAQHNLEIVFLKRP